MEYKPKYQWKIAQADRNLVKRFAKKLNISEILAKILINRRIDTLQEASDFINPSISNMHNPYLMKDMDKAVQRFIKAIKNKEKILFYSDYDADGVASIVILIKLAQLIKIEHVWFHPHRIEMGYGFHKEGVDYAKSKKVSLIITADCGITDKKTIEYANKNNIDVIIIDHHECPVELPNAVAILDPKQPKCKYPFKELAAAGVSFKFALCILDNLNKNLVAQFFDLLELACLGTVVDVMPLNRENRIIVKEGLEKLSNTKNLGLMALKSISDLDEEKITVSHLGYRLGPRINAASRIDHAMYATRLLLTENKREAADLADRLDSLNSKRQNEQEKIVKKTLEVIENDDRYNKEKVIVVSGAGWHRGIVGIVASKIQEQYYKPTIVISKTPGTSYGAGRSIPEFNLYSAIEKCKHLLKHYGGHEQAAGIGIAPGNINKLRYEINLVADNILSDEDMTPKLEIDSIIRLNEINDNLIHELELIEPCGIGSTIPQTPAFMVQNLTVISTRRMGKSLDHLKFYVKSSGFHLPKSYECVWWGMGNMSDLLYGSRKVDIVFRPEFNIWQGIKQIQLNILDLRTN